MLFNPVLEFLFPKGIFPKVYIILWLESEIAYYNAPVQFINHITTGTYLYHGLTFNGQIAVEI